MPRFHVATLGCKVNLSDSMALEARLRSLGFEAAGQAHEADLLVVNTCAVTGRADADGRRLVRRLRRVNPTARLVVTGCLAELSPEEVRSWDATVEVVRRSGRLPMAARTDRAERPGEALPESRAGSAAHGFDPSEGTLWDTPVSYPQFPASGHTRAFVKVQDGCDAVCSFCVIPMTRGKSRSVPLETVVALVRRLGEEGAREVVLTGIHLGHWGRDRGTRLEHLLEALEALERPERIRLTSIEPNEVQAPLVERIAAGSRLALHLHLPLQSGSDAVLARMRRPYTAAHYARAVEGVATRLDRPGIGADVIAGFPGETDDDHRATLRLIASLPLTYLHVFTWSPRAGTDATQFPDRVPAPIAAERSRALQVLGRVLEERFVRSLEGTHEHALTLQGGHETSEALTSRFVHVRLKEQLASNELVPVRMAGLEGGTAVAERAPVGAVLKNGRLSPEGVSR